MATKVSYLLCPNFLVIFFIIIFSKIEAKGINEQQADKKETCLFDDERGYGQRLNILGIILVAISIILMHFNKQV